MSRAAEIAQDQIVVGIAARVAQVEALADTQDSENARTELVEAAQKLRFYARQHARDEEHYRSVLAEAGARTEGPVS